MPHPLNTAIRSTDAVHRTRGEDFPTPDSLYLPANASVGPARDGVERCGAIAPLDAQNRAHIRKILTRLGWDETTPLVAVVDGCEAVVSVGVPDRPTLAKVRGDRDGRLTLPAKVLAALDLVPGEQVWVGGAPGSGQLYLRAAADVLQALTGPSDARTTPAVVAELAPIGRRTRVRPAFEYTGAP